MHPHLFRHQMLTFLTGQKLSDAQIQLLSGHGSKKSLEIYQHLSLEAVEGAYQQAVKRLEVRGQPVVTFSRHALYEHGHHLRDAGGAFRRLTCTPP